MNLIAIQYHGAPKHPPNEFISPNNTLGTALPYHQTTSTKSLRKTPG
ncbi:hypothetical protein [Tenacibaculum litopenaei]